MTSGKEIVPHFITTSNQCVCPEESKPVLTWLGGKARMAGTACLATLSQPAVGPLLIACVCLATLAYKKRNYPKTVNGRTEAVKKPALLHRSMSIAALHGGRATLERILDAQQARIDEAGLAGTVEERAATKLEMSGREDDAIKMLMGALQEAQKNKHSLEAYEFEMLLVEMLIYKAIIYTMRKDKTSAKKYYEEFQSIRQKFHWPDGIEEGSPLYGIVHKFDEFEHIVENLKKEIDHAHKMRANTANS
ncbi:hypothetical protein FCM35_KLT08479 [Carex littledalei]|uniref:Uncharacterized protein n=1 Tax=Carex littledalei TaxID=544730 RepID=A0A833VKG4_9POAL|nr:hypothetical protein FCM35_KLT08479 [Carex littledalei]